jgi:protein-disulfide isomerase
MSKKRSKPSKTKRQLLREQRLKKERQRRLTIIGSIIAVALLLVGLIAIPAIQEANTPVGSFVQITPTVHPNEDGTALGDPEAKVVIDVFEDFKCSACQGYTQYIEPQVIKEIVEPGKAYYVFHQYPFLDDRRAQKDSDTSANASECAAEQNRFWDYKNILYANYNGVSGEFNDKRLLAFADSLELDTKQFEACYDEKRYQDKINEDLSLGESLGVNATPTILVNGQNVSPGHVPQFDQINDLVNQFLSSSGD